MLGEFGGLGYKVPGHEWFPEIGGNGARARQICAGCPYKAPCLLEAIERREQHGIWGGVTVRQFTRIRAELGMTIPKSTDTHCANGHEWAVEAYVKPGGKRACRACNAAQGGRSRARKRVAA